MNTFTTFVDTELLLTLINFSTYILTNDTLESLLEKKLERYKIWASLEIRKRYSASPKHLLSKQTVNIILISSIQDH